MTAENNDHDLMNTLRNAERNLGNGEIFLDFSSVRRLDADALRSLGNLANAAEQKSAKIAIRGANVDVYKVLKLVRLTRRFQFVD